MKVSLIRRCLWMCFLTLVLSCDQPALDLNLPDSSTEIEGTYRAETYVDRSGVAASYPVQGQTMRLKVKRISKDSVRIELEAPPNGDFSSGKNLVYEKLFVQLEFYPDIINNQQVNCAEYRIKLSNNSTYLRDLMRRPCKSSGILYYYYITPVSNVGAMVRFVNY